MYFGTDRNRTVGTAYRQTECTGCPHGVLLKDSPALIVPQRAGDLHHKRELKQAVLVRLLNENRPPDLSAIVFSLRDSGCIFHLLGQ